MLLSIDNMHFMEHDWEVFAFTTNTKHRDYVLLHTLNSRIRWAR